MLDNINFPDDQVKACIHTEKRYHKDEFSGALTNLVSKVEHIFSEKDPESKLFKQNGNFKEGRNKKMRVSAYGMNHRNKKTKPGRKDIDMGISDPSR